jgi:hypothetical protein
MCTRPSEWWTDLTIPATPSPGHRTGDTAIRGTRSDLLLSLTNRAPAPPLKIIGLGIRGRALAAAEPIPPGPSILMQPFYARLRRSLPGRSTTSRTEQ